jgi:hypothetical protein
VLINIKSPLRAGDTLESLIFTSNRTHLLNFAETKKEGPVYMRIGNQSSKIHQMFSMQMLALLPFPIKNHNISQQWLDKQQDTNQEVLNTVLWQVLQPLTMKQNPSAESG